MSAVMTAPVLPEVAQRSAGVWLTAWRRFKNDRVGRVAGVIVLAFLLLIAAAGTGLVASDWQRELAVPNAPPTFLGPRAGEDAGVMAGAESKALPPVDRRAPTVPAGGVITALISAPPADRPARRARRSPGSRPS